MSCRTMFVHAATAGAIEENSVTTQADPEVVGAAVVDDDVDEETAEVVVGTIVDEAADEVVDVVVVVEWAVTTQEQAEETLLGEPPHPARYVGMTLASVTADVV